MPMQKISAGTNKQAIAFILFILISSIAVYIFTDYYFILLFPFIIAYVWVAILNWKLAYWIFLFTIPLSIQFSLPGTSFSLSLPDEPICWGFFFLFILLFAYKPQIMPQWWWRDPMLLIIAAQFLWLIVAVIFSDVPVLSIKFLAAKAWYLVCFFILPVLVVKEMKDFKLLFILFLVPILVTMIIIILRQAINHFSFSSIGDAVGNLYINHVEYSAVISIFFPFTVAAYLLNRKKSRLLSYGLLMLVLFFLPVIYFTYARAAVLAILFAMIVGVAIRFRLANYIMPVIYVAIVFIFLYFLNNDKYLELRPDYNHTYMHSDYGQHLTATFAGRDLSSMERLYRWIAAIRMSNDRPLVGFGPHAFVYNYKAYTLHSFRTYTSNNKEHSTTHNYFLFMLTEQGWPAMLLYALLIMVFFASAQKIYYRFNDAFYKACTLGLAMAFAAAFVNNFFSELIETHKAGAMFYLIIALLMILDHKSKELQPE